jgi:predicted ATP-grasp superfamily ATP-dependent carboligase
MTVASGPAAVVYPDNLAALGVCRSLGMQGVPCVVLSHDRTAPAQYSRYGRRVACPPAADEHGLVEVLEGLGRTCRERPVLFLTDDAALVALHRHRARLEDWYRFPMSPWPVVSRLIYKDELYRELEGVVPVPRTVVPGDASGLAAAARAVGFPAVVKPFLRCRAGSDESGDVPIEKLFGAKAVRVRTDGELAAVQRRASEHGFPLLVQEEIEGPVASLVSVGLYATRTDVPATFTSRKLGQVPADFGDGLVVEAIDEPAVIPLATRAIRHFGYHGMADIEFKWDQRTGTYKLLDINPRPWLWINLPTACGVNLPYAAYLDALGRPVDPAAFVQRDTRTRWVSARGLLNHLARCLVAGRPGEAWAALRAHTSGPRIGPLWSAGDVLYRMFLNPAYWWQSGRQVARSLRLLQAATGVSTASLASRPPSAVSEAPRPAMTDPRAER